MAGQQELARLSAAEVARKLPMPANPRALLDIGGSHGSYSARLAERYPTLTATALDLPGGAAIGRELTAGAGHGPRWSRVSPRCAGPAATLRAAPVPPAPSPASPAKWAHRPAHPQHRALLLTEAPGSDGDHHRMARRPRPAMTRSVPCPAPSQVQRQLRTSRRQRADLRLFVARWHFPIAQATKCLYLVTRSLDPTGTGRARRTMGWNPAEFRRRLNPGLRSCARMHIFGLQSSSSRWTSDIVPKYCARGHRQ
jgi:hypothetical protein